MTPSSRPAARLLATVLLAVTLTGCAATGSPTGSPDPDAPAHAGDGVDGGGAAELAEPATALVVADAAGALTLVDLASEERIELTAGAATPDPDGPAPDLSGTGRFVFVTRTDESSTVVEIVDTGRWTMPHGDHSHYFRAEPRIVGEIEGEGTATIGVGADTTTIVFDGAGDVSTDAVILDHEALAAAELPTERATVGGAPAAMVAGVLASASADGIAVDGVAPTPCAEPRDVDVTRVGTVFACADGAVLVSRQVGGGVDAERIALADGAAAPASLSGRSDRPDLAGIAGGGVWLLDVRERTWTLIPSDTALVRAAAIGDDDARTAVLTVDGRVRVIAPDGAVAAETVPLVAESLAGPDAGAVRLVVDGAHAYVSDPAGGAVHEVALDDGSLMRTFDDLDVRGLELVG